VQRHGGGGKHLSIDETRTRVPSDVTRLISGRWRRRRRGWVGRSGHRASAAKGTGIGYVARLHRLCECEGDTSALDIEFEPRWRFAARPRRRT
jgi:hypothetical protein